MQHLVEHEVYQKRQMSMICLARGLNRFNLLPLIKKNVKGIVECVRKLSAKKILSKVKVEKMDDENKKIAFTMFKAYINARHGE